MDAFDLVLKKIRELRDVRQDAVVSGSSVKDFADYKRLVGVIEGLTLAERELLETQRLLMEHDDDD